MKKVYRLLSLLLILTMAFGLSACGTQGKYGANGVDGKSAYQIWLDAGNTGTQTDFLDWLKGADGKNGSDGKDGVAGADGKNAYQVWLDAGNTGTQTDFLDWIRNPGESGTGGGNLITTANPVDKIADRISNTGASITRSFWEPASEHSWEAAPNSAGKAYAPELKEDGSLFFAENMRASFQLFRILTRKTPEWYDNLGDHFAGYVPDPGIFYSDYQYTFMLKTATDFKIALFARTNTNLETGEGTWIRLAHDSVNGLNIQTSRGNKNGLPLGSSADVPLARASDTASGYQKNEWNRVDMVFSRDRGGVENGAPVLGYMTFKLYMNGRRVIFSETEQLAAERNIPFSYEGTSFTPNPTTVNAASLDTNGNFVWCVMTPASEGRPGWETDVPPGTQDMGYGQRFIVETGAGMSLSLKKYPG